MVQVDESVPSCANFGVHIAGDSMEPYLTDGQIVWVQQCATIQPGEIGIFLYDGASYCKRLACANGQMFLESLNPSYPVSYTHLDVYKRQR